MGSLSNLYISQSYTSLIHLGSDTTITTASVELQDGLGNGIGIFVNSLGDVNIEGTISASNIPADIVSQAELNAYTASTNADLASIHTETASIESRLATIGTQSGSWGGSQVTSASYNQFTASINAYTASTDSDLTSIHSATASLFTSVTNLNSATASINSSITQLNASSASQQISIDALNTNSASVNISISALNTFTASQSTASIVTSITNLNSATASLYTSASLALVTASFDTGTRNLTFTKGDTTQFSVNIPAISSSAGDLVTTASFNAYTASNDQRVSSLEANSASVNISITNVNSATASLFTSVNNINSFTASTAIAISALNANTASQQISIDALNSFSSSQLSKDATLATYTGSNDTKWSNLGAQTGSYVTSAITASSIITASVVDDDITFTKGDGSQFTLQISTGSFAVSASYAETASIARNVVIIARNGNASTLPAGTVVRITSAVGDNPIFNTASYDDEANSSNTLGILRYSTATGVDSEVVVQGTVLGVNTDPALGYAAGDILYLSSSGQFTNVQPQAPLQTVTLGEVLRVQQNNGSIYVNVSNGWELNELHNVQITSPTTGQLLAYESASYGLWKNKSASTLGLATTGSNIFIGDQTITGSFSTNGGATIGNTNAQYNSVNIVTSKTNFPGNVYNAFNINTDGDGQWSAGLYVSSYNGFGSEPAAGLYGGGTGNAGSNNILESYGNLVRINKNTQLSGSLEVSASLSVNGSKVVVSSQTSSFATTSNNTFTGTNSFSGSTSFTGSVAGNVVSASITSNTASIDFSLGNYFEVTSSVTPLHLNVTNIKPGTTSTLIVSASASSSILFSPNVAQPSGSAYSGSAGSIDILSLVAFNTSKVNVVSTKALV